jgi:hypothetical protein
MERHSRVNAGFLERGYHSMYAGRYYIFYYSQKVCVRLTRTSAARWVALHAAQ